ncbi:MAG: TolC family protein [Magnetococcales bacterium]|nr:TolC family protein [Magnetococcales bacterium]
MKSWTTLALDRLDMEKRRLLHVPASKKSLVVGVFLLAIPPGGFGPNVASAAGMDRRLRITDALHPSPVEHSAEEMSVTIQMRDTGKWLPNNSPEQPESSGIIEPSWSFEDILHKAFTSHPAVMSKMWALAGARADLSSAKWQRAPTPSLETSWDSHLGNNASVFHLQQPLWAGGRIDAGIELANSRQAGALEGVGETRQDLALKTISVYLEAIRQKNRMVCAEKNIQEHNLLKSMISRRTEQEISPAIDRELATARLNQAISDQSLITRAYANARAQLAQLAGMANVESISDMDPKWLEAPKSLETTVAEGISHSPVLKRLSAEHQAAGADTALKNAAILPVVALRYDKSYAQGYSQEDKVLVVVDINPGAGLSAWANRDAAQAREQTVLENRDAAVRDLQERLTLDFNDMAGSRERLEMAQQTLASSEAIYASYLRQYTIGKKTWLDVLNAIRETYQTALSVADLSAAMQAAILRLNLMTGHLPIAEMNSP